VTSDENLQSGRAALSAGRWEDARAAFQASLAQQETAEALEGLGAALWWLCEARASARARERAFVLRRKAGEHLRAAAVAVDLVVTYLVNLGNAAAASGWLRRAERATENLEPNPMQGWLWLLRGYLTRDGERSRALFGRALEFARELGDPDLELVALGDLGLALVAQGKAEQGLELLDEAMAGSMAGEGSRLETVVYNSCSMLSACHLAGDIERAAQWCRVADEFMGDYSCPFLFARCRVHYGSLLFAKGQWDRAEDELRAALRMAEDAGPGPRAEALARLAELRIRQGRLEEADELLGGCDDGGDAVLAAAELRLAQGAPSAAVTLLERRLIQVGERPVEAAPVLALLVDAQLDCGDFDAAAEVAARLDALALSQDRHAAALAALASARILARRGDRDQAIVRLEQALQAFASLDLPFETALVRLELARTLVERRPDAAVGEAMSALRGFERIGATVHADEAASLLRSLGQRVSAGARTASTLTKREREVLRLIGLGLSNPQIAQRLFISRKTAAHHVSNILMKLALKNRAELVAYTIRTRADVEAAPDATNAAQG
jgi:DNA-binding CsgD family transcriptional regulator